MTISYLHQEARGERVALALHALDPLSALAGGFYALQSAVPATLALLHGQPGPSITSALFVVSAVLLLTGLRTAATLVFAGFGMQRTREMATNSLPFWIGAALLVASIVTPLGPWLQGNGPDGRITATAMLCGATLGAFWCALLRSAQVAVAAWTLCAARLHAAGSNRAQQRRLAGELMLCGGCARGAFHDRNVAAGAPRRGELLLYGQQSAQRGTIAIGAPGSSKTRSKINADLYWGLRFAPEAGALVFITKKRATQDCHAIARAFRRPEQIHVVGVGADRERMDILAGMSHESIGDAIQDGLGRSHSDFWVHGPSAFVEGFIEVMRALAPATVHVPAAVDKKGNVKPGGEAYDLEITNTLPTLLQLISVDGRRLDAVFAHGFARAAQIEARDPRGARALTDLLHEIQERVLPLIQRDVKLAEEMRQSVLPQLQPFARDPLREAFCDTNGIDLGLMERGHVILIEIDETEYPRAVATVVRMVFRRIVQMARERTASDRIGLLNPILLVCDEYANYASAGHVPAWNTVRESKFCATVGITSVSALVKQLGGDRDAANAIVANFANKFFFEVDDKATRDLARELIGQSIVLRKGTSEGTSTTRGSSSSGQQGGSHTSAGTTAGTSLTEHLQEVLDGEVWRTLRADRDHATAIAFVRTPDGVMTDVVVLGVLDPTEGILTALPEGYGLRS